MPPRPEPGNSISGLVSAESPPISLECSCCVALGSRLLALNLASASPNGFVRENPLSFRVGEVVLEDRCVSHR
jgi:hypothetical protein